MLGYPEFVGLCWPMLCLLGYAELYWLMLSHTKVYCSMIGYAGYVGLCELCWAMLSYAGLG
jgi:hypothetical protein